MYLRSNPYLERQHDSLHRFDNFNSVHELTTPNVGTQLGPEWASDNNSCFDIVDQHTHLSGSGQLIQTLAIDINNDLTFNGYNIDDVRSVRLENNGSVLRGLA